MSKRSGPTPLPVVLHIHKTAGMALKSNFERNYKAGEFLPLYRHAIGLGRDWPRSQEDRDTLKGYIGQFPATRCIFGHLAYEGVHALFPGTEPRYITFLRHPVARIISTYSYFKYSEIDSPWRPELLANNWTMEEWYDKCDLILNENCHIRELLWGRFPEVMLEPHLTRDHLQEAKATLERCWFVGLTEHYEADFLFLSDKMGFNKFCLDPIVNASKQIETASDGLKAKMAARNELDLELYAHALGLHQEMASRPEYAAGVARARAKRQKDWALQKAGLLAAKKVRGLKRRLGLLPRQ